MKTMQGSRRAAIACGAAAALGALAANRGDAQGQPLQMSGRSDRKLRAYDDLMTQFMRKQAPPGASLAVAKQGRLVYARGFGFADLEKREPVEPTSLFRIASLSKPITAVAILQLVQQRRIRLEDKVTSVLEIDPFLESGAVRDQRIDQVTVLQCLQHTGGWDRDQSFDPMSPNAASRVARELQVDLPVRPEQIIRYTLGRPLDSDPGTRYAYSNFGYCLLGRMIERVTGVRYEQYVKQSVLKPLGITRMRLAKNLVSDRAPGEVKYYDSRQRTGRAVSGPELGEQVPLPYGVECLESMDANGGWIGSAVDLVKFVSAFDDPRRSPLLGESGVHFMFSRPKGKLGRSDDGKLKPSYYGCGWSVRPVPTERPVEPKGADYTKWHMGLISGTSTLMVGRADDISWSALFNADGLNQKKTFAARIDPLLHRPADQIRSWPSTNLFSKYL